MTGMELMREIGLINEAYIQEAGRMKRSFWSSAAVRGSAATAACLLVCLGIYAGGNYIGGGTRSDSAGGAAISEERSVGGTAENGGEGAASQDMPAGEAVTGGADMEEMADQETASSIEESDNNGSETSASMTPAGGGQQSGGISEIQETEDTIEPDVEEVRQTSDQTQPEEQQVEMCGYPTADTRTVTYEEALEDALFGEVVPEYVPAGYSLSAGQISGEGVERLLFLDWVSGMRYVTLKFFAADSSQAQDVTDVLPAEELSAENLSLYSYDLEDQGDVAGPRVRAVVLYEDQGIMVDITAKGLSLQELVNMLYSE